MTEASTKKFTKRFLAEGVYYPMTNEKNFGLMIDSDEQIIVSAEDLLRLQGPDIHGFVTACTYLSTPADFWLMILFGETLVRW